MSGSELEWSSNVNNIFTNISTKDPRKFSSWEVIKNTMFVVKEKYIETELKNIIKSKKFVLNWQQSLIENNVGMPLRYWKYSKSSGNLIHHLYHLVKFEEYTNIDFKNLEIVFEFGGGYG